MKCKENDFEIYTGNEKFQESIKDIIERLRRMFEEIGASILEQMRITEQKYTYRIKQYKRYPFCKRIYKPP